MATFGFRLQFRTSIAQLIDIENESIIIKPRENGRTIKLLPVSKDSNNNCFNLVIQGSGYASGEEASKEGGRIKNSILLSGLSLRMGFDIGKDKIKFQLSKALKDEYKEKYGVQIIDDVHGLVVYSEDKPIDVMSAKITGIVSDSINNFINDFLKYYKNNYIISEKQSLALELYNLSHFDKSLRGRYLTLVTVIESLSIREERSGVSIRHLEELIEITKGSNLETPEKESLIKGLEALRKESISRSCRKLVKRHLGQKRVKEFQEYYDVRGHILHNGAPPDGVDLDIDSLDRFVADLLIANVCGQYDTSSKGENIEKNV
jgi:hypothetical protein